MKLKIISAIVLSIIFTFATSEEVRKTKTSESKVHPKIKRSEQRDHIKDYVETSKEKGFSHGDHSHPNPLKFKSDPIESEYIYEPRSQNAEEVHYGEAQKYRFEAQTSAVLKPIRRIDDTEVDCHKNYMIVTFKFSAPFNGYVYPHSKFMDCHLFSGQNSDEATLTLYHGPCGQNHIADATNPEFTAVIEHRLMIQWERDFVCEDDASVIVRCDRPDDYNKTVSWNFETLKLSSTLERSKHPGPKMWMEIQRGEGPNAPPLDGKPTFIGDVLTIVFTLTDDVFWFGSNILSCIALDGEEPEPNAYKGENLIPTVRNYVGRMTVIENECSTKPKVFSHFFKERITKDGNLINIHYAHFKAFRFPTSQKIIIQCDVQVCYKNCDPLPPCSVGFQPRAAVRERRRRETRINESGNPAEGTELDTVLLYRTIEVLSAEDGALREIPVKSIVRKLQSYTGLAPENCYSAQTFYGWLAAFAIIASFLFLVLVWQIRIKGSGSKMYDSK